MRSLSRPLRWLGLALSTVASRGHAQSPTPDAVAANPQPLPASAPQIAAAEPVASELVATAPVPVPEKSPEVKKALRETEKPPLGILPTSDDALMDPRMARSWALLPARPFVATTFDAGFVYVRPRVSLGYGRPFTSWIGVDANGIAQSSGLGAYSGLRIEIPHLDWRVGARYFASFNRTFLERRDSYKRLDLESKSGAGARTLTYETELDITWPVGPGSILARGSMSYVTGTPSGKDVFEEALHVIVNPPLVWRARAGYVFVFGEYRQHGIGVVIDALDVPKREDSLTLRAGPVLRFVLSRRVEVRGSFVMTITSPDRIGLVGGDFTELGVRYRWASE
jgi:hypothetical protein